jgi:hypothetical protein
MSTGRGVMKQRGGVLTRDLGTRFGNLGLIHSRTRFSDPPLSYLSIQYNYNTGLASLRDNSNTIITEDQESPNAAYQFEHGSFGHPGFEEVMRRVFGDNRMAVHATKRRRLLELLRGNGG